MRQVKRFCNERLVPSCFISLSHWQCECKCIAAAYVWLLGKVGWAVGVAASLAA